MRYNLVRTRAEISPTFESYFFLKNYYLDLDRQTIVEWARQTIVQKVTVSCTPVAMPPHSTFCPSRFERSADRDPERDAPRPTGCGGDTG